MGTHHRKMQPLAFLSFALCGIYFMPPAAVGQVDPDPSPYWKNTIDFPGDPFRVDLSTSDPVGWIKFTIPVGDPTSVYYQDGHQYPLHYDFATAELKPYVGISRPDYDQLTLYEQGQELILGAIVLPPAEYILEYGIQFVRLDPYDPAEIVAMFNTVKATINAPPGVQPLYFPTYEQRAVAEQYQDWFASQGIEIGSTARWSDTNHCYADGWALGTLKFVTGGHIENAYLSGDLAPGDILLTDGVPAEVPFVAGILSLTPSTPNSHVAILAANYGVPFAFLALDDDADRAQQLVGRRIALTAYATYEGCKVRLIDVEDELDAEMVEEILTLKQPPEIDIVPMATYGGYSASTDDLVAEDIQYFGGKAANFGWLRRSIPENSPVATAFSFDLWNAFMDQTVVGSTTLREWIAARLAPHTWPPDMAALATDLDAVRTLIRSDSLTHFSPALEAAVIATLQDPQYGFDPYSKIRFRSSTNVEDSEHFTGAGLYDSYSGCLADDLDGDTVGPSQCDPTQANERGVFRAIRRVFASFYNDNAYIERLRHDVNEAEVGMAVLVHHSFPDEIELANGVATLDRNYSSSALMVTQKGAVSVTNPEGGAIPEQVSLYISGSGTVYPTIIDYSSLMPWGETVLQWPADYTTFGTLFKSVADRFTLETGIQNAYTLDFEYKKTAPEDWLVINQVRRLPRPDTTPSITPYLLNDPVEYCTFMGEAADVFANHRLKSRWTFATRNMRLDAESLDEGSIYADVTVEYRDGATLRTHQAPLPDWPGASSSWNSDRTWDRWAWSELLNPLEATLETRLITQVSPAQSPLLTLRDSPLITLTADYDYTVPTWAWGGDLHTTSETIVLTPCPPELPGDLLQNRVIEGGRGLVIDTTFYWPPPPSGPGAGYTAPCVRFVETVITGLTKQPIVLHGYFSQTYRPEHHNFSEHFIFEPRLEPGIDPQMIDELRAQRIELIHIHTDSSQPEITIHVPWNPADFNDDGHVDGADFDFFRSCATGPHLGPPAGDCVMADLDLDDDIDQTDFALFQRCLTSEGVFSDPACLK